MESPVLAGVAGVGSDLAPGSAAALASAPLAPLHPAAREALLAALDAGWADPAALHSPGRDARALLDAARESVAASLGSRPDEVHFASSGPAAASEVILGVAASRARVGHGVVVSAIEHASVLHAAAYLSDAHVVPVSPEGVVDAALFIEALERPGIVLGCLQLANGEVGSRQPLMASSTPLLVDATAAVGHVPVAFADLPAAHLTCDSRAFGGPPGVGIRVSRTGARWRRPGPDVAAPAAVPLVVAAAAALAAAVSEQAALAALQAPLIEKLRVSLPALIPDLLVAGPADPDARLPHLMTVSALFVDGEALVLGLDRLGVGAGSGSACTADTLEPSHVLAAMGFLTQGNLRIALGRTATEADVDRLIAVLPGLVASIRAQSGL